jgi:hypothetical protein
LGELAEGIARSSDRTLDVRLACLPIANGNAHATLASPRRSTEKRPTSGNDPSDDLIGSTIMIPLVSHWLRIEEAHHSLVYHRFQRLPHREDHRF